MITSVFYVATILIKSVSEATSSLFRHPILEKQWNDASDLRFLHTRLNSEHYLLAIEEVVCSDNVSPYPERVDYIQNGKILLFDLFQTP